MRNNLLTIKSAHLLSAILGMPSGPGALYGLMLFSCARICCLVTLLTPLHAFGYFSIGCSSACGLAGKKLLASAMLFSSFVLAIVSSSPILCFSFGILALPPSEGGMAVIRFAAQMSGSSAFLSHSLQCCCLVFCSAFWYLLLASLCSLYIWCSEM